MSTLSNQFAVVDTSDNYTKSYKTKSGLNNALNKLLKDVKVRGKFRIIYTVADNGRHSAVFVSNYEYRHLFVHIARAGFKVVG